jgi:hypothetical protein
MKTPFVVEKLELCRKLVIKALSGDQASPSSQSIVSHWVEASCHHHDQISRQLKLPALTTDSPDWLGIFWNPV